MEETATANAVPKNKRTMKTATIFTMVSCFMHGYLGK